MVVKDLEGEIWKPVRWWEGEYEVSNLGRVKGISRWVKKNGVVKFFPQRLKSQSAGAKGYQRVQLGSGSRSEAYSVHRLVLTAFRPNPENYPCVDHIDSDPSNNRLENLDWVTFAENSRRSAAKGRMGTKKVGELHHSHKLTEDEVAAIRRMRGWKGVKEIGKMFGISFQTVSKIQCGRIWKHSGRVLNADLKSIGVPEVPPQAAVELPEETAAEI